MRKNAASNDSAFSTTPRAGTYFASFRDPLFAAARRMSNPEAANSSSLKVEMDSTPPRDCPKIRPRRPRREAAAHADDWRCPRNLSFAFMIAGPAFHVFAAAGPRPAFAAGHARERLQPAGPG